MAELVGHPTSSAAPATGVLKLNRSSIVRRRMLRLVFGIPVRLQSGCTGIHHHGEALGDRFPAALASLSAAAGRELVA
jgi:hypothetical protein